MSCMPHRPAPTAPPTKGPSQLQGKRGEGLCQLTACASALAASCRRSGL